MTFTSLRLCIAPASRTGLAIAAALAAQLALSGCSPDSNQNAATQSTETSASTGTGPVVAKVNGVEIRESDLALAQEDIGQQLPPMSADAQRDYLITYVGDMILLTQAAEAKKLQDTDEFRQHLEFARKKLLMGKLLETEAKAAATDTAMRQVYDDATKQMAAEQEVRARHILVETEEEAKVIRSELESGADFAQLAKEKSKDPGASAEGGDLGYFTKDQMVPEFAEAAFKLEKDKLSDPVKSPFGWHIIKVEDKRTRPLPQYEQVKAQLEGFVMRKAQAEYLTKLRQEAKVEKFDVKPDTPAAEPDAKPVEPEKK